MRVAGGGVGVKGCDQAVRQHPVSNEPNLLGPEKCVALPIPGNHAISYWKRGEASIPGCCGAELAGGPVSSHVVRGSLSLPVTSLGRKEGGARPIEAPKCPC